jgi:hypothetical protein
MTQITILLEDRSFSWNGIIDLLTSTFKIYKVYSEESHLWQKDFLQQSNVLLLSVKCANWLKQKEEQRRLKQKQRILKEMGLSKQITSVQDYEFLWTILNAGNEEVLVTLMENPFQSNMLEGAFLWIMPHLMCMLNITLGFLPWKQFEQNKPRNANAWTMEYLLKTT